MADTANVGDRYGRWLWLLFAAFAFRVVAQLVQRFDEVTWLPSFDAWHSAVVPYPLLVASQLAILAAYGWLALAVSQNRLRRSLRASRLWLGFGVVYLALMVIRLALGQTSYDGHHCSITRCRRCFTWCWRAS